MQLLLTHNAHCAHAGHYAEEDDIPTSTWAKAGITSSKPLEALEGFSNVSPQARDAMGMRFWHRQEPGWRVRLFGGEQTG